MKKQLSKNLLWQSILSVVALGIFILLATGSYGFFHDKTEYLGNGVYESTEYYSEDEFKITTGKRDDKGRWHGPATIEFVDNSGLTDDNYTEEVNMVNGKRHGKCKTTYKHPGMGDYVHYTCYNMGNPVPCEKKTALLSAEYSSAFQVLSNKYPWFLFTLNAFGFEDEYVEAYMDTLETVLATYEFEYFDFDDYYAYTIYDLEETVYDSIIFFNSVYSIFQGLEELKNDELRLAVIDRCRSDGNSTYNIVNITYPGYLLSINDVGVIDQDFEEFCQDLDSCMTSYGNLDLEDPFFLDSVDTRMYRALSSIMDTKKSSSSALKSLKSADLYYAKNAIRNLWHQVNSELNILSFYLTPSDVATVVLNFMQQQYDQGDIVKRAVREAYFISQGVITVPTVTTEFSGGNSTTSVTLNGYVIEDGGADVTSRGIAWASFYNPTTDDHSETSGTGMGEFTVTLDGLTEGATYYARTFAINSAGTAYGNCISFVAQSTVGIEENILFDRDFNIYPNPASAFTTFSFQIESSENMVLTIVNLKGQVVYHHDPGSLPQGKNQIELDLSGIPGGMYHCQLTNNGTTKVTRKLVILH